MPGARLSMRKTREILRLRWADKRSLREIGLACGVGSTTVHDVLARAKAAGLRWPLPDDVDDAVLEAKLYAPPEGGRERPLPDFAAVYRELKRRGVTLELLWQEYRVAHPNDGYGYSRFCDLYREWRGQLDVVMRQEHRAGEKLFVDWAGMTMSIVDATTGEVKEHPVFVAALGASSFTYAEVCESQALRCWIAGHIHAFEYVGGVTAVTVPDNPKTAVIGPDFYEPDLHATYAWTLFNLEKSEELLPEVIRHADRALAIAKDHDRAHFYKALTLRRLADAARRAQQRDASRAFGTHAPNLSR